jgi:hypothetical protein
VKLFFQDFQVDLGKQIFHGGLTHGPALHGLKSDGEETCIVFQDDFDDGLPGFDTVVEQNLSFLDDRFFMVKCQVHGGEGTAAGIITENKLVGFETTLVKGYLYVKLVVRGQASVADIILRYGTLDGLEQFFEFRTGIGKNRTCTH